MHWLGIEARSSVRVRLTLWNVGVLALILAVLGLALRTTLKVNLSASLDNLLIRVSGDIESQASQATSPDEMLPPQFRLPPNSIDNSRTDSTRYRAWIPPRLLDLQGKSYSLYAISGPVDQSAFVKAAHGATVFSDRTLDGASIRIISRPLIRNGHIIGVIQFGHSRADVIDEMDQLTGVLLTLIPVGLLIAAIGGAFLTGRALQPVRKITAAASRIEAENLSDRLSVKGHDEFALLACTFNGMLDRLESAFRRLEQLYEQQRRFTGDASHELRTPLTIIKANTSLALSSVRTSEEYAQALKTIDHAADRTNRIIQDLLLLARADAGQLDLNMKPISIFEIVEQAAHIVPPHGPHLSITAVSKDLRVLGNSDMLTRLFENLLSNAARHTPPAGSITVTSSSDTDTLTVQVTDTGEGIAPEHLPHLTERFYRVDKARSRGQGGAGLGLAISKSIVDTHQGGIAIESVLGEGTTVKITLPRLESAAESNARAAKLISPEAVAKH